MYLEFGIRIYQDKNTDPSQHLSLDVWKAFDTVLSKKIFLKVKIVKN